MKKVRTILYAVATCSAIFAGYLSFETEARWSKQSVSEGGIAVSDAVDTAKDGGAAGFAISRPVAGLVLVVGLAKRSYDL